MIATDKPDYEVANDKALELFQSLGIHTQISAPLGDVKDEWPNILYNVTFSLNGKNLTTEYRLGVGHVNWKAVRDGSSWIHHLSADQESMVYAVQKNPHATFKNKSLHASTAAQLAKNQKVAPKPYEVLSAICDDGQSAHNESFDSYCGNFGMDSDSIKAKQVYELCCELYHKAVNLIGADNVRKLAELHAQF